MENGKGYYGVGVGWFLVGSVAGACTALLLAPATGKKTREQLARKVRDGKQSVTVFTNDLAAKTRQIAAKAGRISDKAARIAGDASAAALGVIESFDQNAERAAKN